jgi:hypothetical protein
VFGANVGDEKRYKVLVGNPKRKMPFGRPGSRYDNIKMDLREIGLEGVDLIHLAQDRWRALMNTIMSL